MVVPRRPGRSHSTSGGRRKVEAKQSIACLIIEKCLIEGKSMLIVHYTVNNTLDAHAGWSNE